MVELYLVAGCWAQDVVLAISTAELKMQSYVDISTAEEQHCRRDGSELQSKHCSCGVSHILFCTYTLMQLSTPFEQLLQPLSSSPDMSPVLHNVNLDHCLCQYDTWPNTISMSCSVCWTSLCAACLLPSVARQLILMTVVRF